jgi:hypothetical protein
LALLGLQRLLLDLLSVRAFAGLLQRFPILRQLLLQLRLLLQQAAFEFGHLFDLLEKIVTLGAVRLQLGSMACFQLFQLGELDMQLVPPVLHLLRVALAIAQLLAQIGQLVLQLG